MISTNVRKAVEEYIDSGSYFRDLAAMVAYRTVSTDPGSTVAMKAYLDEVMAPALKSLGCTVALYPNTVANGGPFLIARRVESPELPTVLSYGHADVVDGAEGEWSAGLDPWRLTADGDRWYGRGAADNKGQHLINLTALRLLLEENGALGFNLTFLVETGEEIDSPGLAQLAIDHRDELSADVLIASDGPRLNAETPTLFLGARGIAEIWLDVDLRPGAFHSGNWGGLLRNAATTLSEAIATLVDGHGRIKIPSLLPGELPDTIRAALADVTVESGPDEPELDEGWGEASLTPAERLYGWNTLEVLALHAGDITNPISAIPGRATANLQLRYVAGTDVSQIAGDITKHLEKHGFPMIGVTVNINPASRTPVDDPWVVWAKKTLESAAGRPIAVLPNIGGTLANEVFTDGLGVPTLWLPHSYPGCRQHAPDEHMLESIAREGLLLATSLFADLGSPASVNPSSLNNALSSSTA